MIYLRNNYNTYTHKSNESISELIFIEVNIIELKSILNRYIYKRPNGIMHKLYAIICNTFTE